MNLTLKDIFMSLWRSIYLIVIAALVGTLLFGGATYFFIEPEYTATGKLYVYNERSNEGYITQGDLVVSKSLVDTYLIIVKSAPVLNEVAEDLQDKYPGITADEIGEMISGSAINETEAFYISATSPDRQKATDVVNTVIHTVPEQIIRIVKAASVEVIEDAQLPGVNAYSWPLATNMVIGFALGLVISVAYIVAANSLDTTIYGRNEIARNFKVSILGAIPTQEITEEKKKLFSKKTEDDKKEKQQSFILSDKTSFAVSEAFRMARTNIFYLPIESKCKKIAVTSAIASEGKSSCSINVAKSLAQAGKKVLLIDADLRRPRVARYLNVERGSGLSEYLAGIAEDVSVVHIGEGEPDILLSGNPSSAAAELLATPKLDSLFEKLQDQYDYIIVDTPPVNVVTDATVISGKIDGYLLCVRAGMSDTDEMRSMIGSLEQVDARVLGIIITDIDPKMETYGKYSRYGKYSKYGKYGSYARYGKYNKYNKYNKYYKNYGYARYGNR